MFYASFLIVECLLFSVNEYYLTMTIFFKLLKLFYLVLSFFYFILFHFILFYLILSYFSQLDVQGLIQ